MAYTFFVNTIPNTGSVAIYSLISTLMTAGWLKKSDSDGTTFSNTGVQVTSGAAGANGLGNTKAWVRLQAPAVNGGAVVNQTRELIIQRGTLDTDWRIKYSASAGFTGGIPSATVVPSATDEVWMMGAGTDALPTFLTWFSATNKTYYWHVLCGGANEYYSFVAWQILVGNNISGLKNGIALDIMVSGSFPAVDPDPAVMYASSAGGTAFNEITSNSTWPNTNVTNPAKARAWLGSTSAATGSLSTNNVNVGILTQPDAGGTLNFGTNPYTGKEDMMPCLWGNLGTSPKGTKGFSTIFQTGGIVHNHMETCDTVFSGSKDKIWVGKLWLPWNGTLPAI